MKTLIIDHNNGHKSEYQLIEDGQNLPIAYSIKCSEKLINILERCRRNETRIKINIGNIKTGKSWNEENDITGYIGLSRGDNARFPILVNNARSMGGGSLMDHCILQIKESKGGTLLYKADNFIQSNFQIKDATIEGYESSVYIDGTLYSNHKTRKQAERLIKKLS